MTAGGFRLRRLARDARGVTLVEFALVSPVFLMLIIGLLDIGQMVYGKSLLNGAVESAARSSSLESGDTAAADAIVAARLTRILPGVELESTRTSYFDFADVERAEQWNDADGSGDCNDGEAYTDENANGSWDSDIGVDGNGGANDVVLYKVTATYSSLFKVPFMPADWSERSLESTAIRKNQPFATQAAYASIAGTCE